ncbi:MAG: glutaredoxin [Verrucomicrobia bacterium]|nr:glutaredoxin [Verrucomicrobiota bacterium]
MTNLSKSPKIVAYLKPQCGWSNGVRAVLQKYDLPYEDRDIINDPSQREEMVRKSGQQLSPCVEVDGHILADVSGEDVESYLVSKGFVVESDAVVAVPANTCCSSADSAERC